MNLNPAAGTLLVVWYVLASVLNIGVLVALTIALSRLGQRLTDLITKLEPLVDQADALLQQGDQHLNSISKSVEGVLSQTELATTRVRTDIESSSKMIHRAVHTPFVSINAALSGLAHGLTTFAKLQFIPRNSAVTKKVTLPRKVQNHVDE